MKMVIHFWFLHENQILEAIGYEHFCHYTNCPPPQKKKMLIGLSASISFKIVNLSEYAVE